MPRGDKSSYTSKQKRQAAHIRAGYEERGVSHGTAEARAWATVNKTTHGGKKSGSGRGKPADQSPARKGGRIGGAHHGTAGGKRGGMGARGGNAAARSRPARAAPARKAARKRTT